MPLNTVKTEEVCNRALISRVSDQNGVSLLDIMLEIHRSGPEPSICLDRMQRDRVRGL